MMKDLEIAFTAKEITAFGVVAHVVTITLTLCVITSLTLPAKAVYDLYRGRADYLEKKGDKNILRLVRTMNQRQAFLGLWRTTENFDITRTNWT